MTGRTRVPSQHFDLALCPDVVDALQLWRRRKRRRTTDNALPMAAQIATHDGLELRELPRTDPARAFATELFVSNEQFGVYAKEEIGCGEDLGEYGGLIRTRACVDRHVVPLEPSRAEDDPLRCAKTSFTYDHDLDLTNVEWAEDVAIDLLVDARVFTTLMAFINDFRVDPLEKGAASSASTCARVANVAYESRLDDDGWPRIVVVATKTIRPGEQVLADYGEGFWSILRGFVDERSMIEEHVQKAKDQARAEALASMNK